MLGKEEKDFTGLCDLIEYLQNTTADVSVFQTQLTMADLESCNAPEGLQIMNMQHTNHTDCETVAEHTLHTCDLHYAHSGFALSFMQFTETYYRVNKLENIVNVLRFKMYHFDNRTTSIL